MTALYDPDLSVREARERYFAANGFGDGGYTKKWVPVKVGPVEVVIRNTAGRVRSVRLHDLHHIATEYPTTLAGEARIGAWEIGGGCRDHFAAWVLNASSLGFGLVLDPRGVWNAFVRGRRSKNLYDREFSDELLDWTVERLRAELDVGGDAARRARPSDAAWFAMWVVLGLYLLVWSLALLPLLFLFATVQRCFRDG
jgi:hypothetical protein